MVPGTLGLSSPVGDSWESTSEATVVGTEEPKQGSPTPPPRNNPNVIGEQPEESLNNPTSEATVGGTLSSPTKTNGEEEKVLASLGSPRHIDLTLEGPQNPAKEKTIHDPSNVQAPNPQVHPRKANPCQLPLKKHRLASSYYHSAFTAYPRHNYPENIATTLDVLDTLLKAFSSRARVSTQNVWNPIIES